MKWACVGCGQGVDYHGNPITEDERQAWCYDCAEEIERVAKSMGGARCRNCGNSGISPWTGKPCGCPTGKALARLQADNGVEVLTPVADERLRCGDAVRVIGPAATSAGDTFAIGKETTVAELRVDDDGHTVYACQIRGWGFVPFPRVSLERIQPPAQANEPRAVIRHFAAAMERKLAANDGVKVGWKRDNWTSLYAGLGIEKEELLDALTKRQKVLMALDGVMVEWENGQLLSRFDVADVELLRMLDEANKAVLLEAADCANFLMFIVDVIGALPKTNERGR